MRGRGEDDEEAERKKSPGAKKVPFLGMFRYAGRTDLALMAVGTAAAMANGMSEPLMTIIFAAVIESFGGSDSGTVLRRVSKRCHVGQWLEKGSQHAFDLYTSKLF